MNENAFDICINLGGSVKHLRKEAGLTQTQLGEKLGVKKAFISKIERGDAENMTVGTLTKVFEALGKQVVVRLVPI